jgi:hypothetical protein
VHSCENLKLLKLNAPFLILVPSCTYHQLYRQIR